MLLVEQLASFITSIHKTFLSPLDHFHQPVGWLSFMPNTEKLFLFRHKTYREGLFIQSMSVDMDWFPYRWVEPICVLNKNRVSLYARACPLKRHFPFKHFISSVRKQNCVTISFLHLRGSFSSVVE